MIEGILEFFKVESTLELTWVIVGLGAQMMFSMRFVLQWWASEKEGRSVIPEVFWWFSIFGGLTLFAYALHRQDPVFILGQSLGVVIYARNLWLIYAEKRTTTQSV
ncbi:lipid-A-disaccharide synthase N-terminal domain-containing protein [Tritonibacter horizontis]|uniref:Lipid-A-disaccharide synthase n=1 Tax=Tritonibacter horizontis TaxID=1768241 RepID=A0A132BVI5_9RHOB|nr:lipid-A-disaccharide synthase N-terminal domain-containing protein [Tritonibacter horizontis]KUP92395.1 lipid-A-disaccharide synthase [Tritonibacter horizontis]